MILNYIFHFLSGYVILISEGKNIGLFLNLCTKNGIKLDNIKLVRDNIYEMQIGAADFKRLRPIAYKTRTKVHIKRKCYVKNVVNRYKQRVFLFGGLLLCAAFTAITSCFIWSVDVEGTDKKDEVLAIAEKAGIKPGVYKPSLPDGNEIKSIILSSSDFTWAWVYLKGTKAVIEVREGILPPQVIDRNTPCDIAAAHDGIITDIIAKEGIALCKKGDVVLKGDILIGGTYEKKDGGYRLEHAIGDVSAATVRKSRKTVKLFKEKRHRTGRKKRYTDLTLFSKNIPLYGNVNPNYANYSIECKKRELKWGKEHYLGIEITSNTYYEESVERIPITIDEAAAAVKDELQESIAKGLMPGSILKSEEMTHKLLDSETAEVTLIMQFIEKIGTQVELTEEKQE